MSSASWVRVAHGLRLVVSAATEDAARRASAVATDLARNGAGTAESARIAAWAAGSALSSPTAAAAAWDRPHRPRQDERPGEEAEEPPKTAPVTNAATGDIGVTLEEVRSPELNVAVDEAVASSTLATLSEDADSGTAKDTASPEPVSDSLGPEFMREAQNATAEKPAERMAATQTIEDTTRSLDLDVIEDDDDSDRPTRMIEGRPVPSTRIGRAAGFATLGVGLAAGTAIEAASRLLGSFAASSSSSAVSRPVHSPVASDANADRLAAALCRMRGAALKMGQMLSIQDKTMLPPPMVRALEQVRRGADAMPRHQLEAQLESELGSGWRERLAEFDNLPFAAASIGQVHRARLSHTAEDGRVAMKVQYPGVAESIDSDLSNLTMLMNLTGLAPPGLFLEEVVRVGRMELRAECDYIREMENQLRFKALVESDEELLRNRISVPGVVGDLTTQRVITSEFVPGGTIDKVANMEQEERNRIGRAILRLTMRELFKWRFMQTDPNWGNFLYDLGTRTTSLIDFGAAREYEKPFVDGYLKIVWANAQRDEQTLLDESHRMGFLTGEENGIMLEAHKLSGFTVGEPFASHKPYDFRRSQISARISKHSSAFLQHRLTPPPEEVYTLHRKLAGAYNLCIRLGAIIPCRDILEEVMDDYSFDTAEQLSQSGNTAGSNAETLVDT